MNTKASSLSPWLMLFSRLALFIAFQALFALGFALAGEPAPWERGADWWTAAVFLTNIVSVLLMVRLFRIEGQRYRDLFRIQRQNVKKDLLTLLPLILLMGPVVFLPNILLGTWLFGNPEATLPYFLRPLPVWGAVVFALVLFPLTQGLAELASYFGYTMPRLERQGLGRWGAVLITSLVLGLQHIALPLLFDGRYLLWRGLMFFPFALMVGIILRWRPRLLPYLAVIHALMNVSVGVMMLGVAY